jgi:KaiC/GvpD/RAD55 family RecA-like ATPase
MAGTPDRSKSTPSSARRDTRPQWTIKGVSPETRAAVTKAARRDGMKVGAWIDEKLRAAATETLQNSRDVAVRDDELRDQVARLADRVEQLATEHERQAGRGVLDRLFRRSR